MEREGIGLWTLLYIQYSCSVLEPDVAVLLWFRLCRLSGFLIEDFLLLEFLIFVW